MILTALVALLLGFVAVLAVPVEVEFLFLRDEDRVTKRLRLVWLFGLVRKDLPGRVEARRRSPRASAKQAKRRKRPGKSLAVPRIRAALGTPGLPRRLLGFVRSALACFNRWALRLSIRFGLDDPADTGRVYGVVSPWLQLVPDTGRLRLYAEPEFEEARLDFRGEGSLRVTPLRLVASVLGLLFSVEAVRAAVRVAAVRG